MLRVFTAEERNQEITVEEVAAAGGSTVEAVEEAFYRLCALGILTTEQELEPEPPTAPEPAPVPVEYGAGEWSGDWAPVLAGHGAAPDTKIPVVYFMYDSSDLLAYIGSTDRFRKRMSEHANGRRSDAWHRWTARECPTRKIAYILEDREILARDPYQNGLSACRPAKWLTR